MSVNAHKTQTVYVVAAPSAGGKTTLDRMLVKRHPRVEISVSLTTRPKRADEQHGVHYYFVNREEFDRNAASGRMLETAEVHGNFYGTCMDEVDRILAAGNIPLLEIDVQGWISVKKRVPTAESVFILPPSIEVLWKRLEGRGTDSIEVRRRRLRTARHELESVHLFDHFIVNEDLDKAYAELESLIVFGRPAGISRDEAIRLRDRLVAEYDGQYRDG